MTGGRCLFWQLNPDKSPFQRTYANQVRSLHIREGWFVWSPGKLGVYQPLFQGHSHSCADVDAASCCTFCSFRGFNLVEVVSVLWGH